MWVGGETKAGRKEPWGKTRKAKDKLGDGSDDFANEDRRKMRLAILSSREKRVCPRTHQLPSHTQMPLSTSPPYSILSDPSE